MKKKLFLATIMLICVCCQLLAQTNFAYYNNSSLKSQTRYKIQYLSQGRDDKPSVMIEVIGDEDDSYLCVNLEDLPKFKDGIRAMRDKYKEWVQVANTNHVTQMTKEMDYPFTIGIRTAWKSSTWWFSDGFRWNMKPKFEIAGNRKRLIFAQPVSSSRNEYIKNTIYLIFNNVQDFASLLTALDYEKIKAKVDKELSAKDLFK